MLRTLCLHTACRASICAGDVHSGHTCRRVKTVLSFRTSRWVLVAPLIPSKRQTPRLDAPPPPQPPRPPPPPPPRPLRARPPPPPPPCVAADARGGKKGRHPSRARCPLVELFPLWWGRRGPAAVWPRPPPARRRGRRRAATDGGYWRGKGPLAMSGEWHHPRGGGEELQDAGERTRCHPARARRRPRPVGAGRGRGRGTRCAPPRGRGRGRPVRHAGAADGRRRRQPRRVLEAAAPPRRPG